MNSTYTVKVQVEAGGAVTNLEEIDKAVASSNNNLLTMRKELKQIQSELLALEPGTEQFVQLSAKAGEVRDRMNDVSESINANAGPAIESLGNNFSLLGGKLSNLDFQGAAESLKAIGGNIGRISFKEMINGVKGFGSAMASVGKALLTNPIFLIGAAIAAAGLAVKAALDAQKEATYALAKATQENLEVSKQMVQQYDVEERRLRALGVAESELFDMRTRKNADLLANGRAAVRAQAALVQELGNQTWIDFEELDEQKKKLVELQNDVFKLETEEIERQAGRRKKAAESLEKTNSETAAKAAAAGKQRAEIAAQNAAEEEKTILEAANERIKIEQRTQEAIKAAREQRLNEEEALAEEIFQLSLTEQERELMAVRDEYFEKIALAEQFGLDSEALKEEQLRREAEIAKKYATDEVEIAKMTNEQKVSMAQDAVGALMALNEAIFAGNEKTAKKAFQVNKALSLAQAIATTYNAAVAAYASQIVPLAPSSIVRAQIAAGITIASGLANVAKIASTKFEGGGGSGGGGGGSRPSFSGGAGAPRADGSPAPAFNPLNTQFLNNRPDQMTPARAYVLTSDVASGQEATEKINALTTL